MRLVPGLARGVYAGVRTPAGIVTVAVGLALVLRLPFLHRLAFPDEAGLLIVAQHWHEGGANLYGRLFVDRPPLLLLFYQLADDLGGLEAARLMGLVAASVVVAAAGWIGHTLAGRRGTAWAALAAAALVANPMIGTTEINAELLGAPLTLLSVGFLLAGVRPPVRRSLGWMRTSQVALAGGFGAAAVLVKQNLLDALVFGAALAFTVASAVVSTGMQAGTARTREARPDKTDVVGTWLRDASIAGDTGTVLYGNADLLLTAHLPPGTDQLWSLPTRALDPRLLQLSQQLNGPHPPTWVVQWFPLDTWGLDPEHRVLATLTMRYRVVMTVCGVPIYLHRGVHRSLPFQPLDCP